MDGSIICVSDLHIPYTSRHFVRFADYACEADTVVFDGDVLDLVRCTVKDIKGSYIGRELVGAVKKIVKATETIFILGNHDMELSEALSVLLEMEISAYPSYRLGDMLFMHGWQFDPLCKYWNWRLLARISPWFFRPPSEWKARNREKWHRCVGRIYSEVFSFLEEHSWCRLLVIGHTHYPSYHELQTGQRVLDCGDWVDSGSWGEIVGGEVKTRHLGDGIG